MKSTKTSTAGFSLTEVILVVAVMSILVGISTPPLFEFIKRRDVQTEENRMNEIAKAMRSYLSDNNALPDDTDATWPEQLARYTNLSADQIANDNWGQPRMYVRHVVNETFLGTEIEIYYASIHSMGSDRVADGVATTAGGDGVPGGVGVGVSDGSFADLTDGLWWKNRATDNERIDAFVNMQPADDDQMIRLNDYPEKIERYKLSLERLDRISDALESYSITKYNEMVAFCISTPCATPAEQLIFYPRSVFDGISGDSSTYYASNVNDDLVTYNSGNPIDSGSDMTDRRENMINLMRVLGLPDEYCCNALQVETGTKNEVPFYYYSNPRPRVGGACGTRPNPATDSPLPARLTVEGVEDDATICG